MNSVHTSAKTSGIIKVLGTPPAVIFLVADFLSEQSRRVSKRSFDHSRSSVVPRQAAHLEGRCPQISHRCF